MKKNSARKLQMLKKRLAPTAISLICLMLALTVLYGTVNAKVVRVREETVQIDGLDEKLEGVKILFVSDFKLTSTDEAAKAVKLMNRLSQLKPDLIILGGDITQLSDGADAQKIAQLKAAQNEFLSGINELSMPIYAVYGDNDLILTQQYSNITYLNDEQKAIRVNGAKLTLYGVSDYASGVTKEFGYEEDGATAVIAVTHDPAAYHLITVNNTGNKPKVDLILAGHTLGGQINLAGKTFRYADEPEQYLKGEYKFSSPMLISGGIGWEVLPMRLGTRAEAVLVELGG